MKWIGFLPWVLRPSSRPSALYPESQLSGDPQMEATVIILGKGLWSVLSGLFL